MNIRLIGGILLFIISLVMFSVTSDAWSPIMSDAADNSGLEGPGHWFFENWLAVLFGLGAVVMIGTGLFGGGD